MPPKKKAAPKNSKAISKKVAAKKKPATKKRVTKKAVAPKAKMKSSSGGIGGVAMTIVVLWFLAALGDGLYGLTLLLGKTIVEGVNTVSFGSSAVLDGIIFLALAAGYVIAALGLLKRKHTARVLSMLLAAIGIGIGFVGDSTLLGIIIVGGINLLILVYLLGNKAKSTFTV